MRCPNCGHEFEDVAPPGSVVAVIDHLRDVSGRRFTPSPANARLIRARMREGYGVEDFKKVHRYIMARVKAGSFDIFYVRPATLYAPSKFEGYLNDANEDRGLKGSTLDRVRKAREA